MAGITFETVAKRYGETDVIRNLSLDIKDGEFMVLVGPSGCGKSTALRMIAGLESVSAGQLKIADRVVNDLKPKDRDVAMVFQSYALYPHMTVRQNVAFGLEVRKMPKAEIEKRVQEASAILGLDPYLDRKPKALSGGQRQRVALGRAIVRDPSVFLFDEPLSNLDAKLRTGMRAEISRLQKRLGTTAVYVTHDQTEAMTMGDRIAVLAPLAEAGDSNLMQVGTPLELYHRPSSVFVARFIGAPSMSILTTHLAGRAISHAASPGFAMPERWEPSSQVGDSVLLGFRPEDVRLVGQNSFVEAAHFKGRVEMVETLGHEVLTHLDVDGATLIAKSHGEAPLPKLGEMVEVEADLSKAHFFDVSTNLRLTEKA
ncbi:MAG: sn-glycerol-3-phosphate ABC transporter ATP-binding protein UgpC [Aquidulcibacter sp.]|jgi:multiple sugar transport system ATP-binding protein|uniref:ABC transporter ATP-binding protein n=1 Tax=Aquidulcibacter sp. TaxID=2052990 RepID=UPI0022C6C900|nr:sn-glycerol-3-phosphate ABC transporter ATP-binding protein UgpC [Aquidulcibacter sp.]